MASLKLDNDDDDDSDGVIPQRRNQVSQEHEDLVVKGEAFLCTCFWAFLLIIAGIFQQGKISIERFHMTSSNFEIQS